MGPTGLEKLDAEQPKASALNVPELPSPESLEAPHGVPAELDTTRDGNLPNASKLKTLAAPPEYVSKNPMAGLKHVALATAGDPLQGPSAGTYFEPSEHQFTADMGPVLKARGVFPGSPQFVDAYAEYADRKWQQAYQQAQATDTPLTRVKYVQHSGAWDKLKDFVAQSADEGSAFAKGYVNGLAPGSVAATGAASDLATGRNDVDADREQAYRDPGAAAAGETLGAIDPRSLLSKTAGVIGKVGKYLPGMIGRLGTAALAGAGAADVGLAGNAIGQGLGDAAHGRSLDDAKSSFTSHLLGSSLIGSGAGVFGQLGAEGADAYRASLRRGQLGGEVGSLEAGGGATDLLRGIKSPKEVEANVEAARPPVPGENKQEPTGSALELQAGKVQGPIAKQNVDDYAEFKQRAAAENQAEIDRDPNLREPKPTKATANAVVDLVKARTQPEGRDVEFLPGASQSLPGRNNGPFIDLAKKFWKPRLALGIDAAQAARANGGRVVSMADAEALGYPIKDLRAGTAMNAEGVPNGAPEIPDEPVDVTKALPRYSKDQLASGSGDVGDASPEQAEAIKRYTFGKRNPGDTDLIDSYLQAAPVSPLPHVYRGIALPADDAADFLANGTFDTGATPTSVSSDPITARSFAARNQNPGDVAITLKLKHTSARNVQPFADKQVSVEKELMLPSRRKFEIESKVRDPSNPDGWIVTAREVPSEPGNASTTEEVFGRPADKLTPGPTSLLKPRPGRAFKTPTGPVGSDWFDQAKAAETVALNSGDYAVDDPFAAQRSGSGKSPPADTPTTPDASAEPGSPSVRPNGPPSELRPPPLPPPSGPKARPGVPDSEYRVVLEPREYNAADFEKLVEALDDAAKADRKGAHVDPAWKDFQRSIRQDREQFGQRWVDLKAAHHAEKTALEQRAGHANLGDSPSTYEEMPANAQKSYNAGLVNFGSRGSAAESNAALRSLAERAGVKSELETLRAQRARDALTEKATPALHEGVGVGGAFARLGGLVPAMKLRADAAARAVSRGPEGTSGFDPSKLSPELLSLVRKGAPIAREVKPAGPLLNVFSMGRGALGLKAGSGYNATRDRGASAKTLSPEETKYLEKLLAATEAP